MVAVIKNASQTIITRAPIITGLLAALLWVFSLPQLGLAQSQSSLFNQTITSQAVTWRVGTILTLQTLDKVTARIGRLPIEIGSTAQFGTLQITAHHCAYRPPEEPPENTAFLTIQDVGYDIKIPPQTVFSGWMFASSPAVSSLEHAVYDVSVLTCDK